MDKVVIATDGGCRGNQSESNIGAWGAILTFDIYKNEISGVVKNTTNNQMEMKAVIEALKAMKRTDIPVEILSDSAYVCNCINKKWYVSWRENGWVKKDGSIVKNYELWQEMIEQIDRFDSITFTKVKGHSTHQLNNEVDALVNKAMDSIE